MIDMLFYLVCFGSAVVCGIILGLLCHIALSALEIIIWS